MRHLLLLIVAFFGMTFPFRQAQADSSYDKIRVIYADSGKKAVACGISLYELGMYNGREVGRRYICAQIPAIGGMDGGGDEMTPETLGVLVGNDETGKGNLLPALG